MLTMLRRSEGMGGRCGTAPASWFTSRRFSFLCFRTESLECRYVFSTFLSPTAEL
jgi:hypothetical protein